MPEIEKEDKIKKMEAKFKEMQDQSKKLSEEIKREKYLKKMQEREAVKISVHGHQQSLFDMQISLKTVLIFVIGILIISSIFLLGRYTSSSSGIETAATTEGDQNTITEQDFICPGGTIVKNSTECPGAEAETTTVEETPGTTDTETTAAEETTTATETTTTTTTTETAAAEEDTTPQSVITTYKNVKLEFRSNGIDVVKTSMGKVLKVYYKITNNEAGIIKPKTISFVVDDGVTAVTKFNTYPLPSDLQEIKKGKVVEWVIDTNTKNQAGKTINPLGTFALTDTKAKFKMVLKDGSDKVIATASKEFPVG